MHRGLRLSLVIPCYNEEDGIEQVLRRVPRDVDETIVVDNASTDATAERARAGGARVVAESRRGYGAAYKAGLAAAQGDVVATLDGDGTYPPEHIPRLVDVLLDRQWDFLSACRFPLTDPRAMSWTNRLGNAILSAETGLLFGYAIRDSQSGMWVFRRALLPRFHLTSDGMAFSEEIKLEALLRGARFGEDHVPYGVREGVVKLQRWRDGWANLTFLVRKRLGWIDRW